MQDLVEMLKEKLEHSFEDIHQCPDDEKDFVKGKVYALHDTLDLIRSQAIAFDISLNELTLSNYNLERFLYK